MQKLRKTKKQITLKKEHPSVVLINEKGLTTDERTGGGPNQAIGSFSTIFVLN